MTFHSDIIQPLTPEPALAPPRTELLARRWAILALLAITLLGSFFRLYRLDQRGIVMSDEAGPILQARQWVAGGKLFAHRLGYYKRETAQDILSYVNLKSWCSPDGQVATAFFHALGILLLGDTVYGAKLPFVIFGILTIPILAGLVWRALGSMRLALVASTFVAISPACVCYSRGLKAEAAVAFFLLLAVWFYWEGTAHQDRSHSARWILASGLLAGLALTCDGRPSALPIFFLATIGEVVCLRHRILTALANLVRVLTGIILVVLFWEIPYHWALVEARNAGIGFTRFYTYWEALGTKIGAYSFASVWKLNTHYSFDACLAYFYFLFRYEGPAAALAILGIVVAVFTCKRFAYLLPLICVLVGFGMFWACPHHWFYLYSFSLPLICLLGGIGFWYLLDLWPKLRPRWSRWLFTSLGIAVLGWDIWGSWESVKIHSRLNEATQWLKQNHPNDMVWSVPYTPMMLEYDAVHIQAGLGVSLPMLRAAYPQVRFLLLDPRDKYINGINGNEPVMSERLPSANAFTQPLFADIEKSTKPIATFTNEFDKMWFFMWGSHGNNRLTTMRQWLNCINPKVDSVIRIYDVGEVLQNLAPPPFTIQSAGESFSQ